jgi:Zn-dependent M28 family amino/carboxypeptidase
MKRTFTRNVLLQLIALLLLVPSLVYTQQVAPAPAKLSAAEIDLANRIKVESIQNHTATLSADDMQGRGTAQPGGDKAAQYIADQFAKLKLKPLGDKGSYLQAVKFWEYNWQPETTLKVGNETFKFGDDYVPLSLYGEDKNRGGDLLFIAYGMQTERPKRDDLTGVTVDGQIVVLIGGPPPAVSQSAWDASHLGQRVIGMLIQRGAAGVIILPNGSDEHPYSEAANYMSRRQLESADAQGAYAAVPPIFMASDAVAEKLFAKSGRTWAQAKAQADGADFKPYTLKQNAKMITKAKSSKGVGSNVIGYLEGSDPKLKDEAIVFTAHYDAYGLGADGRIYHGAADNALGVAEMLAVAEAYTGASDRPRRSMIFMAVTGEEYGGLGSDFWVHNPTWKIKQVAADLNLDGIGSEVYGPVKTIVGFGAEHSTLGPALIDVVAANNLTIIRDPMPDEKAFYRSDHYMFVKKGVPGLMLLGAPAGDPKLWVARIKAWEKGDYHQPGDVIKPDWNWEGPRTVAVVMAQLGLRIANADAMPAWVEKSPFNRERGTNEPPPPEP